MDENMLTGGCFLSIAQENNEPLMVAVKTLVIKSIYELRST